MTKIGLDDYLLTHTKDEFLALPQLELDDPIFEGLHKAYNEWKLGPDKIEDVGFRALTDVGNAERLALRQRENDQYQIHYCDDAGWRYFTGTHWERERGLNEQGYIVPGAGGMGEVLNNSWC